MYPLDLSSPIHKSVAAAGLPFAQGLSLVGWLLVAAWTTLKIQRHTTKRPSISQTSPTSPRSRLGRLLVVALTLALLHALGLLASSPLLERLSTLIEPLWLTWPFVVSVGSQEEQDENSTLTPSLVLVAVLYLLALMGMGLWRLTTYPSTIPLSLREAWNALTLGSAVVGQLLLGTIRRPALRAALLLFALGAVLDSLALFGLQRSAALLAPLLVMIEARADTKETPTPGPQPPQEPLSSPSPPSPEHAHQLALLTSISVALLDAPDLPAALQAVVEALAAVLQADVAYLFLAQETDQPQLILVSRHEAQAQRGPKSLTLWPRSQLPALFEALAREGTLVFNRRDWSTRSALDALYSLLGQKQSGPTLVHSLTHQGQRQGLFIVGNPHSQKSFSNQARSLFQTVAAQIAAAVAHTRTYQQLHGQTQELQALLESSRTAASQKQAILESIADGVIVADNADQVVLVNEAAAQMLSAPPSQLIGQPFGQILARMVPLGDSEAVGTVTQNHSSTQSIQAVFRMNGQVLRTSMAPVITPRGKPFGTVSVLRDITPEYKAEQAKSEFITNISHELRTPLTTLQGYTDLIANGTAGELGPTQAQFFGVIQNHVQRLTELINSVIALAELERGPLRLDLQPVDLRSLLSQAAEAIAPRCEERPLRLNVELPSNLPPLQADPAWLRRMVDHLLDNAYKFTPPGGQITLQARVLPVSRLPSEIAGLAGLSYSNSTATFADVETVIVIDVRDSGIGIAPEDQSHLFERLFRAPSAVEAGSAGLGVGLFVVKAIVDAHRGHVRVQSQPDQGSRFTVFLPAI